MYSETEINERFEIIKEYCEKFRKELTIFGAVLAEKNRACSAHDYIKFMNALSSEVFLGNYLTGLFDVVSIPIMNDILENGFEYLLDSYFLDITCDVPEKKRFYELMNEMGG